MTYLSQARYISGRFRTTAIFVALAAVLLGRPGPALCQWTTGSGSIYYAGGNVGIGTSSPLATLDLGAASGIKELIYGSGGSSGYQFGSGVDLGQAGNAFSMFMPGGAAGNFEIVSPNQTTWPYSSYTTRFVVQNAGNVGIGTASPAVKLHVASGGITAGSDLGFGSLNGITIGNASGSSYFTVGQAAGNNLEFNWIYNATASNAYGQIDTFGNANDIQIGAAPMTIKATTGNVGIGTTAPQYPLSVNGTIQAKEVLVNTGWSDYVFEPGYRLAPLTEVAAYVRQNHHLPEIPSAAEVAEKGISVGEMQAKLLAKVEELTLHMIQTEKENRELRERVFRLERRGKKGAQ